MEAGHLQSSWLLTSRNLERKHSISVHFSNFHVHHKYETAYFITRRRKKSYDHQSVHISCSSEKAPASVLKSDSSPALSDESKITKMQLLRKSKEVEEYLNGRCLYLVGMMGSGKTTVGKVLSESFGYSFCDCDTLIEEAVGASSVAEIFKSYGESFFRDNETKVLQQLSFMRRLVVSTGGGAVIRPINWTHMRKGITIWLDVPLETLTRRITAVGTHSRPLLHQQSGEVYTETMKRLTALFEERGESYANADVKVSLEYIAAKLGISDVCKITEYAIAFEVLLQMENFLKR